MTTNPGDQALASGVRRGERRALAKAITLLESTRADHRARANTLLNALLPHTGQSLRLGISGVPGVGKSTFIDVLGLWLGPSGGEGAKQWMTMLTELKNRGVADALIVCCDGLKGLPDAIHVTWPQATVQTCVVHMVRNSLRYASKANWGQITKEMRAIYTAPTVEAAEIRFAEFADNWRDTYPAMISSWENAWGEFVPFLEFPAALRKIVYTTNAIESLNARFRKAVRHRGHFPNEQAALKVLYLAVRSLDPKGTGQVRWITRWKPILNVIGVSFQHRMPEPASL